MEGREMVRRWEALLDALDREEAGAALRAAQLYVDEWQRVFWQEEPGSPAFEEVAPDLEFHDHLDPGRERVYHGSEGLQRLREEAGRETPEVRVTVEAVEPHGDRILLLGRAGAEGEGDAPGGRGRFPWGAVWTIRDRRIVRADQFLDPASARALAQRPA